MARPGIPGITEAKSSEAAHSGVMPVIGYLTISRVITEHNPVHDEPDGSTFGQLIDQRIRLARQNGDTLTEIRIEFSPEQWERIARG